MNRIFTRLIMFSHQINRQHVQLICALLALATLVVGVGAPSDGGGAGRRALMGMLHHHFP